VLLSEKDVGTKGATKQNYNKYYHNEKLKKSFKAQTKMEILLEKSFIDCFERANWGSDKFISYGCITYVCDRPVPSIL
jgi:hypothetical protein